MSGLLTWPHRGVVFARDGSEHVWFADFVFFNIFQGTKVHMQNQGGILNKKEQKIPRNKQVTPKPMQPRTLKPQAKTAANNAQARPAVAPKPSGRQAPQKLPHKVTAPLQSAAPRKRKFDPPPPIPKSKEVPTDEDTYDDVNDYEDMSESLDSVSPGQLKEHTYGNVEDDPPPYVNAPKGQVPRARRDSQC